MKRILLAALITLSFAVMKAGFLKKGLNQLSPEMIVIPINALPDYNITFKANPYCSFPYWKIKPPGSKQNKLAVTPSSATIRQRIKKLIA